MADAVYEKVSEALKSACGAVVVSIVDSDGSVPRKTGAMMYVSESGEIYGTIGGGNLEKYCAEQALKYYIEKKSEIVSLDLDGKSPASMICGGKVKIDFRFFDARKTASADLETFFAGRLKKPAVYIFGAGHVGKALCPVLAGVGFDVYMVDDRTAFADRNQNPLAKECYLCDFEKLRSVVNPDPLDYIVIMTHGHIADRTVLLDMCRTQKGYIGCIGSRRKIEMTKIFLRENGVDENRIESVSAPIGLEIEAETPEEIAISIAAEMIKYRNTGSL